jgi:phospholipase A1
MTADNLRLTGPFARGRCPFSVLVILLGVGLAAGVQATPLNDLERCLLDAMTVADDGVTIGELKASCRERVLVGDQGPGQTAAEQPNQASAVDQRLAVDQRNTLAPFTLMAHKPNYILVASYNASGINPDPFREQFDDPDLELDSTEAKFQISLKFPLLTGLWGDRADVFAAYTNRSFWQVYNSDISSPFRETNHEPEIWLQLRSDWQVLGFTNRVNQLGFVHQSNGRGGVLSRSWNRLYANFIFERNNWVVGFKPWYRLPESDEEDDNPDITDFLGHTELRGAYKCGRSTFSLMLRNNIESGFEKGATELSWSFPIFDYPYVKGYVQYFNGYGESMIDYNQHSNSIGFGFLLTDWL